jgi:hypothetical protein
MPTLAYQARIDRPNIARNPDLPERVHSIQVLHGQRLKPRERGDARCGEKRGRAGIS